MESRTTRLLLVCLVAAATVVGACSPPATGAPGAVPAPPSAWTRPVAGAVVRPFVAPRFKYGPGHRGVDFAAAAGTPAAAVGAGTVVFAGEVAGSLHVVVDHGGGVLTSLSFLLTVAVHQGQPVSRGQVLGTAGGNGPEHDVGMVHLGLRVDGVYVDPMRLFAAIDLAAAIRLVPVHERPALRGLVTPGGEARSLAESLRLPRHIPGLEPPTEPSLWQQAKGMLGSFLSGSIRVGRVMGVPLVLTWHAFLATPLGGFVADLHRMGSRFGDYLQRQEHCTADGASSGPGSGHLLFAVGGINSHTDRRTGHTFDLDTRALGYHSDEVGWFSYRRDGRAYTGRDTYQDLRVEARGLRDQLRAFARANPSREVDLAAHSQGGVVVDAFLELYYDPSDPTLPPLGNVLTFSSPHDGATIARVAAEIGSGPKGHALLRAGGKLSGGAVPPVDGTSTRQLDPHSGLMRELRSRELPSELDVTSIGAVDDTVVDEENTHQRGARSVLVNPAGANDHSLIVRDPQAMRAARLALELRPPECVGVADGLRGAVEPVLIRRVELSVGHAVHRIVDPGVGSP